jgi:hypothetical protein
MLTTTPEGAIVKQPHLRGFEAEVIGQEVLLSGLHFLLCKTGIMMTGPGSILMCITLALYTTTWMSSRTAFATPSSHDNLI